MSKRGDMWSKKNYTHCWMCGGVIGNGEIICNSCTRLGKPHPHRRWKMGEKGRINISKSQTGLFGKKSHRWKGGKKLSSARANGKRKNFGFIPLNDWFKGCEGHHIDKEFVIHIPKKMHRSIYHSISENINMDKINFLAMDFISSGISPKSIKIGVIK